MRAVSLVSTDTDPFIRCLGAELLLQLARCCRPAPAPAYSASKGTASKHDIAKSIIEAGGLAALWDLCSDPSHMASPVALAALATLLGTAAAMSRSAAAAEAVLALVSDGAVGRLAHGYVGPAVTMFAASAPGDHHLRGPTAEAAGAATSALLALHNLAANPDPAVHGLFLAAAGVDDNTAAGAGAGGAWNTILSSVETAADGRAGPDFLEAALLAAGSVCGAPPLPSGSRARAGGLPDSTAGERGLKASEASAETLLARILPAYDARARGHTSAEAATVATSRGLAAHAVALLDRGASGHTAAMPTVPMGVVGGPKAKGSAAVVAQEGREKVGRAALRVVWALSRGPKVVAAMLSCGALPRVMDVFSASRSGLGVGDEGASEVLMLETIAAFLSVEGDGRSGGDKPGAASSVSISSSEAAASMSRAVGELFKIVLGDGSEVTDAVREGSVARAQGSSSMGLRSLSLLATAAANPRLRQLVVDHPRFPAVLDLLLTDQHLDGSPSSAVMNFVVFIR